jgi:hypothetical protein
MARTVIASTGGSGGTTLTPSINNWATGTFGTGLVRVYGSSFGTANANTYTFTCPTGITKVRVRCWGAGGGGPSNASHAGGAGGGFAIGEFDVEVGTNYTVTVGAGGVHNTSGGTSSFGTLISATGGASAANNSLHEGGIGVGGYINYKGGYAANGYCGGGGAASVFGHGNPGTYNGNTNATANQQRSRSGGAGGGYGNSNSNIIVTSIRSNFSPWGYFNHNIYPTQQNTEHAMLRQQIDSIDLLATGAGGVGYHSAGANGVNGGGGASGGEGGWPGGGGGTNAGASTAGYGADGCVIVEY